MPMECPECGAVLTAADREADDYRCGRCGALVRTPRRTTDEYDDRPRRRRRPPAKGGGGSLLLILGAVAVLLLLACGGIIGAVVWAGKPKWEEFRSPAGGYTVELPAKARPDMAQIAAKHGPIPPGVTCEGTILLGRLEEYSVVYTDINPLERFGNTDDRLLDQAADGLKNAQPPARVLSSKNVTVSGYSGRELELDMQGQKRVVRIVVTRTRVYRVIAGGPLTPTTDPRVRRFVESFKLTEPKPAAVPVVDEDP
jgi:hypothetical protein